MPTVMFKPKFRRDARDRGGSHRAVLPSPELGEVTPAVSAGLNAKKIGAVFRQKTGREVRDPHHGAEIRAIVLDWTIFFSFSLSKFRVQI
ncbi:hypothetical protein L484_015466 [Morus notabilis]|uniref:Uncharacterized protein n=1 Tax=Morus notabilis TaxID=981085 RepID=W9RS50_9ROSA|nr:hypothetical protein L484_015466 [Morus notabilis]